MATREDVDTNEEVDFQNYFDSLKNLEMPFDKYEKLVLKLSKNSLVKSRRLNKLLLKEMRELINKSEESNKQNFGTALTKSNENEPKSSKNQVKYNS